MTKTACPCGSGRDYRDCCRPLHKGEREAPDAEALMRSRFSAYALGEAGYLWKTLAANHEDRGREEAAVLRDIRRSTSTYRYRSLTILDRTVGELDQTAAILFLARVFLKGADVSFVERSEFVFEGAWRYLHGTLVQVRALKGDPLALRLDTFEVPSP